MALYGYPTITLKDKDTGKIKKEISCKNIQTIPARMMMSGVKAAGTYSIGSIYTSGYNREPESFIYSLPYRLPKNPYSYISKDFNSKFSDGQAAATRSDVTGIENIRYEEDAYGRTVIVLKGIFYAPNSGVRHLGTICVSLVSSGAMFFTPLDEIIIQDGSTVIDVTYKIIVSGKTEEEYVNNLFGCIAFESRDYREPNGKIVYPPAYKNSIESVFGNYRFDINYSYRKIICGLSHSNISEDGYSSIMMSGTRDSVPYPDLNTEYSIQYSPYAAVHKYFLGYYDMKKSGAIIGYVGKGEYSISPNSIQRIKNKKGVSTTMSKRRPDKANAVRPFFEGSSIKKGAGKIVAVSATEKLGFPERWEIDVVKSGQIGEAEFRVRKAIVSGYLGNSNIQTFAPVTHLSYPGCIHKSTYKKYKHPDGILYETSPAIWPLYGQNIAIVIRKGVLLTSVGNARYVILDETNLPHENRGIQITGIAWDDSKKGLLIGCGESGLYRVDFDNDTDNEPTVKRITKDGIERVYAMSGNGKGHVAIVTDTGIMYSDNLGDTWNTKAFDVVKKQLVGLDSELNQSFDYEDALKYGCKGFILSRDGESVGICLLRYEYTYQIPFIKLKTEEKGQKSEYKSSSHFYSNDRYIEPINICISPKFAEQKKSTVRDIVNSRDYYFQPGAAWGISNLGLPAMVGFAGINIGNGDITGYNISRNVSDITGNEYTDSYDMITYKGDHISTARAAVSNGRWSISVFHVDNGKRGLTVSGANIGLLKDNPEGYIYYSSDSESFSGNSNSIFKAKSGTFEIDGVKFEASGDRFEEGDCFVFHRTFSYVNDNVSTARFTVENSYLPMSDILEQSGTISEGQGVPKYRHPVTSWTNMYVTQDGRIKTKDRAYMRLNNVHYMHPQYILPGSSKMNFNLSSLKGGFLIYIVTKSVSNSDKYYKNVFLSKGTDGIMYYCSNNSPSYYNNFLFSSGSKLLTPNKFSITIDSEKRGVTVNDGDRVIWTSGSDYGNVAQISYAGILPLTMSRHSGTNKVGFSGYNAETLDGEVIIEDSEIQLPTFEYAYRGAICVRLGDENNFSGSFDPVFYGMPSIGSSNLEVEIDGKPAEVVSVLDTEYANGFFVKTEKPNRGGVSSNVSAGQVKIEPYTGLVFFSDEDIGKSYKIRYRYYKGDSLGIGEAILE